MLLKDSLARLKNKWKKGSADKIRPGTPLPSTCTIPAVSTSTHSNSPLPPVPLEVASQNVPPTQAKHFSGPEHQSVPSIPENNKVPWSGIKLLLTTLESSAGAFSPLKSAISRLNSCINIYEGVSKERKEYEELREKLDGLLGDLAEYMAQPMSLMMTNSVKRLCSDIEAEIKNVEDRQTRNTGRRLNDAIESSSGIYECYRRIHGHLERLTLNANMNMLKAINDLTMETRLASILPTKAAIYNSAESSDIRRRGCAIGTRKPQIELLLEWSRKPEAGRTCWMNGMAGTGKTTIAYTVCSKLDETFELGASFFCSRVIPECRQVKHIIPSIAYQLARFSLPFLCALVKILESNPDAHTRVPKVQYQKLIVEPLLEVQGSLPTDFIVVIDALDECESEYSLGEILDLILSPESILPIRFLVSSRPEVEIYRRMMGRVDEQGTARLVLHDLDSDSVKSDIETYMRSELAHIPLTDAQWLGLIERCGLLFIYASTTCRYIEQGHNMETVDEAVSTILGSTPTEHESGEETTIDELYFTILMAAFNKSGMSQENRTRMKNVLETVICAQEPLTLDALAGLLGLGSAKQVGALLKPLRSVLNVTEATRIVTTLHASFPDFMLSSNRSSIFHFVRANRHVTLAQICLQIIDNVEPAFNICRLSSSYLLDNEVEDIDERARLAVPPGLLYACRYWSAHLYLGEHRDGLLDIVHTFFSTKLLLWMEILNITKNVRFGTSIIKQAENWCRERAAPVNVAMMAHDAWEFLSVYANHPISQSTPHIYVSMLPFWPRSQPISMAYIPRTLGMLKPGGTAIGQRRSALLGTWNISNEYIYSIGLSANGSQIAAATGDTTYLLDTLTGDRVLTVNEAQRRYDIRVAISPNGTQIASRARDGPVYLLDTSTGDVTELCVQRDWTDPSITFSPDGSCIAFGSSNNAYIYGSHTRELILGPLKGHTDYICSVAFSPNGLRLASGSRDKTIRIWDVKDGHTIGRLLEGHTNSIESVAYSPDGSRLASASYDCTIRVWDLQTGQTILGPLKAHTSRVKSVAFSPNGTLIASGSEDRTIRLYDALTGQTILGPFEGHTDYVTSVVFSPDNKRLFSCSHDGTIRIWNVQDLGVLALSQCTTLPDDLRYARYSPDGRHAVSGSSRGPLYVWSVQGGEMVLGPLEGHTHRITTIDYSQDNAYIASASWDGTLRIWYARDGRDLHGPILGHADVVRCIRFSPDTSLVASASTDRTVRIWDVKTGQPVIKPLEGHSYSVSSIAFSPNGLQIVSGSTDGTVRVWDRITGQTVVGPLRGHSNWVSSVEFSPDGSYILSACEDRSIRIWDALTGQMLLVFDDDPSTGRIYSVAFSPDGRFVVSGSYNPTIRIWDAQSGRLILALKGHTNVMQNVQFSPDGSQVMSSSSDGTIRFWDVSSRITDLKLNLEEGSVILSPGTTTDPWSLDDDGWVTDQQKRRLVWVPADLRVCLLRHPNDTIISHRGSLYLNFEGANIGELWAGCYRP